MIENHIQQSISDLFENMGLGTIRAITALETASGNDKYLINTADKKLVLTIYNNRSSEKVDRIYRFLQRLHLSGFKATYPVAPPAHIEGRPYLILEYIEGSQTDTSVDNYMALAGCLGTLYTYSHDYLKDASVRHDPRGFLKYIPDLSDHDDEKVSFDEVKLIEDLLLRVCAIRQSLDPHMSKGLIHGDAILGNAITSNTGELILIDFDNLRQDVLVLDLGYLVEDWLTSSPDLNDLDIKTLIGIFKESSNLSAIESDHIELYMVFAIIDKLAYTLAMYFANKNSEAQINKLKSRTELLRRFSDYIITIIRKYEDS